jgi:hypothetical protein
MTKSLDHPKSTVVTASDDTGASLGEQMARMLGKHAGTYREQPSPPTPSSAELKQMRNRWPIQAGIRG